MKELTALDLSETANVGNEGLEHIKGLTNLEDLNLWSTTIDDAGMPNLASLRKLKRLNLDKCYVTDEGLKHIAGLENLDYLHIGSTKISDAGLEHLKGLKNLKTLVVTYVERVSGDGVDKLQEALPGLADVQR
jgi:Leucine-rich repeat (LRR) protein